MPSRGYFTLERTKIAIRGYSLIEKSMRDDPDELPAQRSNGNQLSCTKLLGTMTQQRTSFSVEGGFEKKNLIGSFERERILGKTDCILKVVLYVDRDYFGGEWLHLNVISGIRRRGCLVVSFDFFHYFTGLLGRRHVCMCGTIVPCACRRRRKRFSSLSRISFPLLIRV